MTRVTSLIASLLAGSALAPLQAQTAQPAPPPAATETPQPDSPAPLATETTGPAPTDEMPAAQAEAAGAAEGAEIDEEGEEEAIVVTGQRPRGSVAGDIQPEVSLSGRQLRAFGAGNLTEVLDALAPETQSGRGRGGELPVFLLAGGRISGFQ